MLALSLSALSKVIHSNRPSPEKRTFKSDVIDQVINNMKQKIGDPLISLLFENCFPNTLDTTVLNYKIDPKTKNPNAFIITGDIHAMWLRDSTNQVLPYLDFADSDPNLKNLLIGVINRQVENVLIDPYANAYNLGELDLDLSLYLK